MPRVTDHFSAGLHAMRRHDALVTQFPEIAAELCRLRAHNAELMSALACILQAEMYLPDHPQRQSAYRAGRALIDGSK